jgi:hypothetical protein
MVFVDEQLRAELLRQVAADQATRRIRVGEASSQKCAMQLRESFRYACHVAG